MNIGILGSGDVAKALARGFLSRKHRVAMGTRDAAKLADFRRECGDVLTVTSFADAAKTADIVVLATHFDGGAAENALKLAGSANLDGKVLIDVTNPLKFEEGKLPELSVGYTNSAGETVQRAAPNAKVVKAFNIVGNQHMVDPKFPGGPPTMFIAGDDADAKKTVTGILTSFGWETIDAGGIEESRLLEALAMLWIHTGIRDQRWDQAFKLLRK
jgi:8-hydroxy-5-deazaflavin:NADPH oxidoreductase